LLSEAYVKVSINPYLAFSSQQFFPSIILFLPKASHTKKPKVKASSQYPKAKDLPKQKVQKPKVKPLFLLQRSFMTANRVEPQGGV
jgi:hypothetical protein